MKSLFIRTRSPLSIITLTVISFVGVTNAQQAGVRGDGPDTLSDTPQVLGSAGQRFRVVPIKG